MPTGTAQTQELRGSQKLLQTMAKNSDVPSSEEVIRALHLPAGVKIPYWLLRGTPAWLELAATVETPIAKLGDVVNSFVKLNDSTINLKILINGVPIPDIARVIVRNTPGTH